MEIIVLISILVLVIAASGCTSTSSSNKTYSDGVISFSYPSDFENSTIPGDITSGSSNWETLSYMVNGADISMSVDKNPQAESPTSSRDDTESGVLEVSSGKISSTTTETNPNDVVVERSTNSLEDPDTGDVLVYYDMFFRASNGDVYSVSVWGVESKNQDISNIADIVFNSIET